MVQGFPWCLNEAKSIGIGSLVAKILCKKHNSDLSEVDDAAIYLFKVFREGIRLQQARGALRNPQEWAVPFGIDWTVRRFVIDGPRLERWFLKTLVNLSFGRQWIIGQGSGPPGWPSKELVEIAFGRRRFPKEAGLHIMAHPGQQIDSHDRVNITPMSQGDNLVAGRFNFRGYSFFLNLLPGKLFPKLGESDLLYRETTINWNVSGFLSHAILFKGWAPDDLGNSTHAS